MSTDMGFSELPQDRETWQALQNRGAWIEGWAGLVKPHACVRHESGWRNQMCSGGNYREYRVPIPSLKSILHLQCPRGKRRDVRKV